nr:unnamed protein product [Callosobruchus chinensis]
MSKRRRRNNANKNYNEDDSENESEQILDLLRRLANRADLAPMTRRKTTAKRKKSTTPRAARGRHCAGASTSTRSRRQNLRTPAPISIDSTPIDDGEYDERVRNRVNSHFKSTVLISDSEDEVIPPVMKPAILENRFSNKCHVLSDSDDDDVRPSTSSDSNPRSCSHTMQDIAATENPTAPIEQDAALTENTTAAPATRTDSNVLKLIVVVDDIIEHTKSPEKPPVAVEDWKAKTEELISSADAIMKDLYEMTGKTQKEEPKKQVEEANGVKTMRYKANTIANVKRAVTQDIKNITKTHSTAPTRLSHIL